MNTRRLEVERDEAKRAHAYARRLEAEKKRLWAALVKLAGTANEVRRTNTPEFMEHLGDAIFAAREVARATDPG